jgi:hypothetical protein
MAPLDDYTIIVTKYKITPNGYLDPDPPYDPLGDSVDIGFAVSCNFASECNSNYLTTYNILNPLLTPTQICRLAFLQKETEILAWVATVGTYINVVGAAFDPYGSSV